MISRRECDLSKRPSNASKIGGGKKKKKKKGFGVPGNHVYTLFLCPLLVRVPPNGAAGDNVPSFLQPPR